jgi:hypothetical protein
MSVNRVRGRRSLLSAFCRFVESAQTCLFRTHSPIRCDIVAKTNIRLLPRACALTGAVAIARRVNKEIVQPGTGSWRSQVSTFAVFVGASIQRQHISVDQSGARHIRSGIGAITWAERPYVLTRRLAVCLLTGQIIGIKITVAAHIDVRRRKSVNALADRNEM